MHHLQKIDKLLTSISLLQMVSVLNDFLTRVYTPDNKLDKEQSKFVTNLVYCESSHFSF